MMSGECSSTIDLQNDERSDFAPDDNKPIETSKPFFHVLNCFSKEEENTFKRRDGYTEFGRLNETTGERTLGTFSGVFSPVALSMFSALLFLRVGFVVGNAGLWETLLQFFIAYSIIVCTVSSICAISTNGEVQGGGAYCILFLVLDLIMISRTLGPEFGGSIGTLFFFANIVSSALYTVGFAEGLIENFGPSGYLIGKGSTLLPNSPWWSFAYASVINGVNLIICLVGANMFAKTSVFIFITVTVCISSSFMSFAITPPIDIPFPEMNTFHPNSTGAYTSFAMETFKKNLYSNYSTDYTSKGIAVSFSSVFGVLFSGVTGIMAGANMSGELKNPRRSIPTGTVSAVVFTMLIYVTLSIATAASCDRYLLQNNYIYLLPINVWPPFVAIGILTATFSASLSNLIGSSRVIEALARDHIFGQYLNVVKRGTWNSNPVVAVLISWLLVQLMLLIGSLNTIAQINSILFLLSYLALNLACLGLELASAPNFRPAFKYFTWHTAIIGLAGSFIMMFVINPFYASTSIGLCLFIVLLLHLFSPARTITWGSISQALIFHQVRKYLLLLDPRKDHVKFWRPQMLLMVSNPRAACPLIDFINDLKKSGLYVLGHVKVMENYLDLEQDPVADEYANWLSVIDALKVKAFVEITVASKVREGLLHLIRISGIGAMKPNTIIFGFYDEITPSDFLNRVQTSINVTGDEETFPLRNGDALKTLKLDEYVQMINDVLKMKKNLCLCRHFNRFDKSTILKDHKKYKYIDVWSINVFQPNNNNAFDPTGLFMLQLACIVTMVQDWKHLRVRVFVTNDGETLDEDENVNKLKMLLNSLRIIATVHKVEDWPKNGGPFVNQFSQSNLVENVTYYFQRVNEVISNQCQFTAITFVYLPVPSIVTVNDSELRVTVAKNYLYCLTEMTNQLPPTILVHGVNAVTSTTL